MQASRAGASVADTSRRPGDATNQQIAANVQCCRALSSPYVERTAQRASKQRADRHWPTPVKRKLAVMRPCMTVAVSKSSRRRSQNAALAHVEFEPEPEMSRRRP